MLEFLRRLFALQPALPPPPPAPSPVVRFVGPRTPGLGTLRELLEALPGRRLPPPLAVELVLGLSELLVEPHQPLGSLGPGDVRFTAQGKPLIAGRTVMGRPLSVPSHMCPEQVAGRVLDARSDVFSLASLLHECLAGEPLFPRGESEIQMLSAILHAQLPPRPEPISPELHAVLTRALAAAPGDRFQTVRHLQEALAPFRGGATELSALIDRMLAVQDVAPFPEVSGPPLPPGDERARLVYADFLEEQGRADEACWLRQESALRSLEGGALDAALLKLRELSDRVGTAFMASVSRPALEGCPIQFGFKCPRQWESLQRTARDDVRHCSGCRQDVHFVRTLEEGRSLAINGQCVALAPDLVRSEEDLVSAPGSYVGRLA